MSCQCPGRGIWATANNYLFRRVRGGWILGLRAGVPSPGGQFWSLAAVGHGAKGLRPDDPAELQAAPPAPVTYRGLHQSTPGYPVKIAQRRSAGRHFRFQTRQSDRFENPLAPDTILPSWRDPMSAINRSGPRFALQRNVVMCHFRKWSGTHSVAQASIIS